MLGLIERLEHVRAIGIEPGRGHLVHQARLAQLAREAGRTTVQHVAGYERQRRHATLVATTLDITASLTDQAIDLFDRLVGAMFRKAEGRHARAFQADARAINEKVRLYARVGAALIAARDGKQDAYGAIATVIPWERFRTTVARSRGAGASGGVRYAREAWRALCRHPSLVSRLPGRVRVRGRARLRLADARDRGAARGEPHRGRPAEIRADRLRAAALGALRPARRHDRPAPLRALRAVGTARSAARRRRLGRRQPAIPILRGAADLGRDAAGAAAGRHPADRRRARLRAVHRQPPDAAGRAAEGGRCPGHCRQAAGRDDHQWRAEDRADREGDAARGRSAGWRGSTPCCRASASPTCWPRWRAGPASRLLHPSAHRRDRGRQPHPDGRAARRRAQSRPDAHGRGVQHRQPRPARLDLGLAHPRGDLRPGAALPGQPAAARALRGASSAAAPPRHRTASSSRPPASAATPRG